MSVPWATAILWRKLDGRTAKWSGDRNGRPGRNAYIRPVTGFLVGTALILGAYGNVDRLYLRLFTYPRQVVVAEARCGMSKVGCIYHDVLSTPDGHRLRPNMYDMVDGNKVGQTLWVHWDIIGYASPRPVTYSHGRPVDEGDTPVEPAWALAAFAALYAVLTGYFAHQQYRRQHPRGAGFPRAEPARERP
jgi:hypothetical protein